MTAGGPSSPPAAGGTGAALALRHELARKTLHLGTVAVPVAYAAGMPRATLLAALLALALVALVVEMLRARHEASRAVFVRATGILLREHEHARWAGATWLLLAFLLAVAAFPRDVAIAAMVGVALGDAAGAVVGRAWSHRRAATAAPAVGKTAGKTWVGSAACLVATALGAWGIAGLGPAPALLAGTLAAAAERPRIARLDDNMRIVIAVGAGILLWRIAFS